MAVLMAVTMAVLMAVWQGFSIGLGVEQHPKNKWRTLFNLSQYLFSQKVIRTEIPKPFEFLFHPTRHKVAYGDPSGAKSWVLANTLVILATQNTLLVRFSRELHSYIADSVKNVFEDQIIRLGLAEFYQFSKNTIISICSSELLLLVLNPPPNFIVWKIKNPFHSEVMKHWGFGQNKKLKMNDGVLRKRNHRSL